MPTTNSISYTSSATDTQAAAITTKTLDRDAFLKMLITELQNQDPMAPMEDKDFIAQLAQFSTLEQMQKMSQGFDDLSQGTSQSQALSLIGRWVDYPDPNDTSTSLTAMVDSVTMESGVPMLHVGSSTIDLADIQKIYPGAYSFGDGQKTIQALDLIGKTVQYFDTTGTTVKSGKVEGVSFDSGSPRLVIGSDRLDVGDVVRVQESSGLTERQEAQTIASAMVGKMIDYTDTSSDTGYSSGLVASVSTAGEYPTLKVGSKLISIQDVVKVYPKTKS